MPDPRQAQEGLWAAAIDWEVRNRILAMPICDPRNIREISAEIAKLRRREDD